MSGDDLRGAVVGIGSTDFSRRSGRSELTLASQAGLAALDDAGLVASDVDGVVRCEDDPVAVTDITESLGLGPLTYYSSVGPGGVAPAAMVGQAVAAVLSGQATTVLVYRALNGRSGRRFGAGGGAAAEPVGGGQSWDEFFLPYGLVVPGQFFALLAQRHMSQFGTTSEQLGAVAVSTRDHANRNPAAQLHDRPLTLEDYMDSPVLSDPLRRFDFCLETDGACALVVTSAARARDLRQPPVVVRAVAQGTAPGGQGGTMWPVLAREDILHMASRQTAETLYRRAGIGPEEVDVAQVYDCFTITVLLQLEDYGLCPRGESGPFAEAGHIGRGGRVPVNTAGGHLSEGYIHGMNHVLEGVRQIRGTSTGQVPGAEVSLVTSAPPIAASALLLTGP